MKKVIEILFIKPDKKIYMPTLIHKNICRQECINNYKLIFGEYKRIIVLWLIIYDY